MRGSGILVPCRAPQRALWSTLWSTLCVAAALGTPAAASAQRLVLRIAPPLGDTLRMEMRQQFAVSAPGGRGRPARSMVGTVSVWTHAVAVGRDSTATELVSVTDSVRVAPASAALLPPLRRVREALEGRTVRLRIATDGELRLAPPGPPGPGATPVIPDMTPVLPRHPVAVGDSWSRVVSVPLAADGHARAAMRATLRLDSVSAGGMVAYVSLHGTLAHDHATDRAAAGHLAHGHTTGTIDGTLELDRRLAWITDSRMTLTLDSTLRRAGGVPRRVHMRIVQWLHALAGV